MIIRFRGKVGTFRVNAENSWSMTETLANLEHQLPPHSGQIALSSSPNTPGETYQGEWQLSLSQLGITHGDMLFFSYVNEAVDTTAHSTKGSNEGDDLDMYLSNSSGRIHRDQTSLCTHGPKGMCEYCQPLEPWDEDYQHSKGIKHISIHAWRKKTKEEGGFLETPVYSVDKNCHNGHSPWPRGFCSKCQPPAITLQQQRFRMVDHVEFVDPKIMENFIEFWRQSSTQRFGFLIGKYAAYDDNVPLGIKAEVHAIWEPQQINDTDSLMVQELPTAHVIKASKILGLEVVGVIFSDLVDSGEGTGKVITKRHLNSYFLSSLEVLFAARMQNEFPHGDFSSRFVTCCVSGNEFGDIDVACYQASLQAEAMAKADLIVPSTNPSVMRIQDASDSRYVPDIFYKRVNEYKLTIQENAKPAFPVDYLLVSLSHGFKTGGDTPVTVSSSFTIENRPQLKLQTPSQVVDVLDLDQGLNTSHLIDFHLLLYLLDLGVLQPSDEEQLISLVKSLLSNDTDVASVCYQLASGPGFNTLRMLASS